ncbi:MAG: inositol monophosphatase [Myxococcota bacterium]
MSSSRRASPAPGLAPRDLERLRELLCAMQDAIRSRVVAARASRSSDELAAVDAVTAADTIYRIDRVGEDAIVAWLEASWPRDWAVELVMEGDDPDAPPPRVPRDARDEDVRFVCIVDPVDGTRSLMHDKRSAWTLAAVAPVAGASRGVAPPRLRDTVVAAMTELPPTKQTLADQVSAVRGAGRAGLRAVRVDVGSGARRPFELRPSTATDCRHGFASFARFFPEGRALVAAFEESLWAQLYGADENGAPLVFDDQYICTGGQLYELLAGRDRMLGDLRPLAFAELGLAKPITCHPYDACTALVLEEAGCRVTAPFGGPLDFPLDTTSPVAWVGFANAAIEAHVRPALDACLARFFPRAAQARAANVIGSEP